MRRFTAAAIAVMLGTLVFTSATDARGPKRPDKWQVVIIHVASEPSVVKCLDKTGREDYTYEEDESASGPTTEVVLRKEFASKAQAEKALKNAAHCNGPERGVEFEGPGD